MRIYADAQHLVAHNVIDVGGSRDALFAVLDLLPADLWLPAWAGFIAMESLQYAPPGYFDPASVGNILGSCFPLDPTGPDVESPCLANGLDMDAVYGGSDPLWSNDSVGRVRSGVAWDVGPFKAELSCPGGDASVCASTCLDASCGASGLCEWTPLGDLDNDLQCDGGSVPDGDSDGDGVSNDQDACPWGAPAGIDLDGDGCRGIEEWQ